MAQVRRLIMLLCSTGKLTPVFFGSAVNNFGVQLLLDCVSGIGPLAASRTVGERVIEPEDTASPDSFSRFRRIWIPGIATAGIRAGLFWPIRAGHECDSHPHRQKTAFFRVAQAFRTRREDT